jgi:hypothetical protein
LTHRVLKILVSEDDTAKVSEAIAISGDIGEDIDKIVGTSRRREGELVPPIQIQQIYTSTTLLTPPNGSCTFCLELESSTHAPSATNLY